MNLLLLSKLLEYIQMSEKPDVKVALATFNERLMAGLIDYGIVFVAYIIGVILNAILTNTLSAIGLGFIGWLLGSLFYLLGTAAAIYIFIWMPYKNDGKTLGKKKQNIKIMFIEDEAKWSLRPVQDGDLVQIVLRAIVGGIEATWIPVIIAWYFITNDKNRQRLADQLLKTVVAQCDSETGEPLKKPRVVAEKKKE
jgi:uncharacterized RDD family membrane protein YckC